MADNDFFKQDDTQVEPEVNPEVFKIGEKEYSQEDLQKLVGLGEIAREAEEKWKTPINKVFPEYTRATQRVKELEEAAKLNPEPQFNQPTQPGQLTQEQRAEAVRQLKDLGFVSKDEAQQYAFSTLQADKLVNNIDSFISSQKEAGNPETTREDMLNYMRETGINDPKAAYKVRFENELDRIKEEKLATIKGRGLITTEASTAGSKQPTTVKVTRQNLGQVVADALQGLS